MSDAPAPPAGGSGAPSFDALWSVCEYERSYSQVVSRARAEDAARYRAAGETVRAATMEDISTVHARRENLFAALCKLIRRIEHAPDVRAILRAIAQRENAEREAHEREKAARAARMDGDGAGGATPVPDFDDTNGDA